MTATLRWIASTFFATALAALLLVTVGPGSATKAEASTATVTPSSSHPFSDPIWYPLHGPSKIGCAVSDAVNCPGHHHWAIDLRAEKGDPVYASGAGIAHIGGNTGGCSGSGEVNGGRWVWVDHGAGLISRYHHLDKITIAEGQAVTPATTIGEVGSSGDTPPCQYNYLHFEIRQGGLSGDTIEFGTLKGCRGGKTLKLPQIFGFTSWDDPGLHPAKRFETPQLDSSCLDDEWNDTPDQPNLDVTRGDGSVTVGLGSTKGVDQWMVNLEIWRPTLDKWRKLDVRYVSADKKSTVFTDGIDNGRKYRASVLVRNDKGWSGWSDTKEALAVPDVPRAPRFLEWKRVTHQKKSYIHFGWYRPESFGQDVTSFSVARRCGKTADSLGKWKTYEQSPSDIFRNVDKLKKNKACELKVRAANGVGSSAWSETVQVKR